MTRRLPSRMLRVARTRFAALLVLALAGCGDVVIGDAPGRRADLRLEGDVAVSLDGVGRQRVSGRVVNLGDVTGQSVRVALTTFVCCDADGFLVQFDTIAGVPVTSELSGLDRLRPGEGGAFIAVVPIGSPPVEAVFVDIDAFFPALGHFFLFTPGLVIIVT